MTSEEQIYKTVSALKSHTVSTIRENQKSKLPIIITGTAKVPVTTSEGLDDVKIIDIDILNLKQFHYKDNWYVYKYSADNPKDTFGILKVANIPFRGFNNKREQHSFVCRMDRLIYQQLCEPFAVFVNRKFVNWNDIDVVYDCGDMYLLLHGDKYNWYNLSQSEVVIMILPFKVEYIGYEDDTYFDQYLEMLTMYMQNSLVVKDGKATIQVPKMDGEIQYNGLVYNVGAWLYTQIRMNYLGILSEDRVSRMKKITLYKYEYDEVGNIRNTYATKFNAFDKDVYEQDIYDELCNISYDDYIDKALFRFNNDGEFDPEGKNIIALLDEDTYMDSNSSDDEWIYNDQSTWKPTVYRENFVLFKDGLLDLETGIETSICNITRIHNEELHHYDIKVLCYAKTENTIMLHAPFKNYNFITSLAKKYIDTTQHLRQGINAYMYDEDEVLQKVIERISAYYLDDVEPFEAKPYPNVELLNYDEAEEKIMVQMCLDALDYVFTDKKMYEDNISEGISKIVEFNPLLLKDAFHTNINSTLLTGKECNAYLDKAFDYETRKGLKIPRMKYNDHETYVIIFKNGELIENYCKLIAAPNYFFLPVENKFADADQIEFLYFTDVNNTEINFKVASGMLKKFKDYDDDRFVSVEMFDKFIKHDEIKYFCKYPKEILFYGDLIEESDDLAFNVTYRDEDGNVLVFKDVLMQANLDLDPKIYLKDIVGIVPLNGVIPSSLILENQSSSRKELEKTNRFIDNLDVDIPKRRVNEFTAVSSRKFIYERLYVDNKAYRIKLSNRFKYCDNQNQFILFINGRRMNDDSFLVTIPKYTRPFWGMYIYLTKFVGPDDRVEVFYVPEELRDVNENDNVILNEDGYVEANKQQLSVPLSTDLYLLFVNGKKIAGSNILDISSNTLRITADTKTLKHIMLNPTYQYKIKLLEGYMHGEQLSKYDELIEYIKGSEYLNYSMLNKLFGSYVKMSDVEDDMLLTDVARIAIINEIVRDFWVTSGYAYNEQPFIYDYALDEIIVKDGNGNYIIPALDANPNINIPKADTHLLYFYSEPDTYNYEIGSILEKIKFFWEYSEGIFSKTTIVSQKMNDEVLGTDDREYEYTTPISENKLFKFVGNTFDQTIEKQINITFCNGVYYGAVDEDALQHYQKNNLTMIKDLIAIFPNDGRPLPTTAELEADNASTKSSLKDDNTVVEALTDYNSTKIESPSIWTKGIINLNDLNLVFVCMNGKVFRNGIGVTNSGHNVVEYEGPDDLQQMLGILDCKLQDSVSITLEEYILGSNNYFVYAVPKRLAYDDNGNCVVKFIMPDINDPELIAHGKDDHTTPVYTNGLWDDQNCLIKMDKCEMVSLGDFYYVNPSGYGEMYSVWRSNGFFTRCYDDYPFTIKVMNINDQNDAFKDVIDITEEDKTPDDGDNTDEPTDK